MMVAQVVQRSECNPEGSRPSYGLDGMGINRNYPALLIGGNAVLQMVPRLRIYPTPFAIIASAAAHMAAPRAT